VIEGGFDFGNAAPQSRLGIVPEQTSRRIQRLASFARVPASLTVTRQIAPVCLTRDILTTPEPYLGRWGTVNYYR
jgi:hypothetical protein